MNLHLMFGPSRAKRDTMASADFPAQAGISRDKRTCFRCIHAGSTQSRVMGTRFQPVWRPHLSLRAFYPVSVRHVAPVTKASSRPPLTRQPLPSYIGPVPKTEGDFHPRATSHARRTKLAARNGSDSTAPRNPAWLTTQLRNADRTWWYL